MTTQALPKAIASSSTVCPVGYSRTCVGTTTTDATSRFLRPITDGFATATAVPLKVGRTLIILEVEVRDDHGKLAVKTSQTQIVLNR